MSTDSLFKSKSINSTTVDVATKSLSSSATKSNSLFATITPTSSAPLFTSTPPVTTNPLFSTVIPNKPNDVSSVPPAFFIATSETENTFEPQVKETRSLSTGYGDRRLSGILSTELPTSSEKRKQETTSETPKKRTNVGIADPNRGIFGNGQFVKRVKETNSKQTEQLSDNNNINNILTTSNTIKVFGYPTNLINTIIQHFVEYGRIIKYEQAPYGNWIQITYENNASAIAALKSNGVIISKRYLIGVILHEPSTGNIVKQRVIPVEEATGLFKTVQGKGLGSGNVGVSAVNNPNEQPVDGGFLSSIKEFIFGW